MHKPKPARPTLKLLVFLLAGIILAGCGSPASSLEAGDPAPAFSLPTAQGGEVALSDYRGQPVLLYFHMAVG